MPDSAMREITFAHAVREALDQSMGADERVIVVGEGVPDPKTIFGSTAGLREKYGPQRVFDMPLAENGMTGICIGAALTGMRPVMVHQRIDFALLAFDQLVNNAAKWHYMFDGKASVPLVVRLIVGRGWGQGPQHSQSLQAIFAHIPGLKVVMPTTAHDAKGMLIAAIEDDNPVLFIEHRWLHSIADHVPVAPYRVSLDRARVMRAGAAVTVAAFSYMTVEALLAARALADLGIDVEVIDMRSISPLDTDSVALSVRKTGRLVIVDTGVRSGGISGELASEIVEREFSSLRRPPVRLAMPSHPVPTSPYLAANCYPGAMSIADAVLGLMEWASDEDSYTNLERALTRKSPLDVPNPDFRGPF